MGARGNYAKGEIKRKQILSAVTEAVAAGGSRYAHLSEVARKVGLTKAGLLHYFPTREVLYEEVLRARDVHDRDQYTTDRRGVEGYFAVIEHNREVPGLARLYAEFSVEATREGHPAREFFLERYTYLREALCTDIADAQSTGEMGPHVSPEVLADLLIAAADGLQVQWLLNPDIDVAGRLRVLWRNACIASHHPD